MFSRYKRKIVGRVKCKLAFTLYGQKKYEEAEELLRQAVRGQEKKLGEDHINTLNSKYWLGRIFCEQKKYNEAEERLRQAVQGQEKKLGKDHIDTLNSKYWLGRTLCQQKKYDEARNLLPQAFQEHEKELSKDHIGIFFIKHWFGCSLYGQKYPPNSRAGTCASIAEYAYSSVECLYCRILLHAISELYPGWIDERREMKFVKVYSVRLAWNSQPYIQLQLTGEGLIGIEFDNIEIRIDTDDEITWNVDPRGSLSRFEWEQAESWLKNCVNSHAICRIPNPHFVPKRLLQVKDSDSNLRLIERKNWDQHCPKYCALSYCWGPQGDNVLTTKNENVEQHLRGMRLSSMPQTIQDAIIICRSLNIPYLWVDALCIIQDDDGERDWYEQSGEMCDIYSNAHLVISADASPSGNFGFLPGRDHINKPWKTVRLFDATTDRQLIASVRAHKANTGVFYNSRAWNGKSLNPLLQRGWAFQESMLANRLLRFKCHGMEWECNHAHKDEINLLSRTIRLAKLTRIYPNLEAELPKRQFNAIYEEEIFPRHITDFMSENTSASTYHAWQGIVSHYTNRDLTKIADKLSALSGLARLVSEALAVNQEAYLAGHWKDDLASSLLWYISQPKLPNRSFPYRAPSWSWASVNGQIRYFHEQYQFHFMESLTIHSAQCFPYPLDPFGRVTFGELSVTGLLVSVFLHISSTKSCRTQYTGNGGCARHPYPDQFSWVSLFPSKPSFKHANRYYEVLLDDKISPEFLLSMDFTCLLIGKHVDSMTKGRRVWWLVLRRTLTDEDRWERIGIGYFHEYRKSLQLFDNRLAEEKTIKLV